MAEVVDERIGVYRLLGFLWRREVGEALLTELCETDLREAFEAVGGSLPESNPESVSELAIDYCQLLIGPKGHVPPFQSVWQNGRLCGDATASMLQFIDVSRYDTQHLSDGQFVDHIGVQFDVMAHLIELASNCPPEQSEAIAEILSAYSHAHLRWAGQFFEQVKSKANTDFYRSLAVVTQEFLANEREAR